MKFLSVLACGFALLSLSACGPVYKTEYAFTAPPTLEGKTCANHCLDARQACYNACTEKEQTCRSDAALNAKLAYLEYANTRLLSDQSVDKTLKDFEKDGHCSSTTCNTQCDDSHRICHVNCGGGIEKNTYCTSFCD